MLELRIMNAGTALPLFDLPAMLGRQNAARAIGDTIESLIAFMDDLDGDPDREANGDEADGTGAKDDFKDHGHYGPGCPIADAGEAGGWHEGSTGVLREGDDDGGEDDDPESRQVHIDRLRRARRRGSLRLVTSG